MDRIGVSSNVTSTALGLQEGDKLAVYFSDDDCWFEGKVASSQHDNDPHVCVEFDEGGTETIDTVTTTSRKLDKGHGYNMGDLKGMDRKRKRVQRLQEGARISVYWPLDQQFFTGTLMKIKPTTKDSKFKSNIHFIHYDDGDKQWTNLNHRKFRNVPSRALRLQVGSTILVRDLAKRKSYRATVTEIRTNSSSPHCVQYEQEDKASEWLNLNVHPFQEVKSMPPPLQPEEKPCIQKKKGGLVLRKRKREFLQDLPESEIGKGSKKLPPVKEEPRVTLQAGVGPGDGCCICSDHSSAIGCSHILCQPCFQN